MHPRHPRCSPGLSPRAAKLDLSGNLRSNLTARSAQATNSSVPALQVRCRPVAAFAPRSWTRQLLAFSRKEIIAPTTLDLNVVVADMRVMLDRLIREDVTIMVGLRPNLALVTAATLGRKIRSVLDQ